MKKILFLLSLPVLSLLYACSANNEKEVAEITAFIENLYTSEGLEQIYDESWLKQHCTEEMLQQLKDEYEYDCYDGDCYGSWLLIGEPLGDIEEKILKGVHHDNADADLYVAEIEYSNPYKTATIYVHYRIKIKNGIPVIEDVYILDYDQSSPNEVSGTSAEQQNSEDIPYGDHFNPYFKEGAIYYDDRLGHYVRNPSAPRNAQSQNRNSSYQQETTTTRPQRKQNPFQFYNESLVYAYLNRATYKSDNGAKVTIEPNGIYVNGQCHTGGIEIDDFSLTRAIIRAETFRGTKYEVLVDTEYDYIMDISSGICYMRQ